MKPLRKRAFLFVAKVVIAALLLHWAASRARVATLWSVITSASSMFLLMGFLLIIPVIVLKSLRWQWLLKQAGVEVGLASAVRAVLFGLGVGMATPGRVGELARVTVLPRDARLVAAGLVLLDRFFDFTMTLVLATFGVWALFGVVPGLIVAGAALGGCFALLASGTVASFLADWMRNKRFLRKPAEILGTVGTLSRRCILWALAYTVFILTTLVVHFWILLRSMHVGSFRTAFQVFPILGLTNVAPIAIGGLGVREGMSQICLGRLGVAKAVAFNAGLLHFFANVLLPGLAGLAWWALARPQPGAPEAAQRQ